MQTCLLQRMSGTLSWRRGKPNMSRQKMQRVIARRFELWQEMPQGSWRALQVQKRPQSILFEVLRKVCLQNHFVFPVKQMQVESSPSSVWSPLRVGLYLGQLPLNTSRIYKREYNRKADISPISSANPYKTSQQINKPAFFFVLFYSLVG